MIIMLILILIIVTIIMMIMWFILYGCPQVQRQQHILETQQTIFGTQDNIIETQHNFFETQHKIFSKFMQNLCSYTTYKPFITLPLTCSAPTGNIFALEYDDLFYLPENSGFEDFKCPITQQQLDNMAVYFATVEDENLFLEYFSYVLEGGISNSGSQKNFNTRQYYDGKVAE